MDLEAEINEYKMAHIAALSVGQATAPLLRTFVRNRPIMTVYCRPYGPEDKYEALAEMMLTIPITNADEATLCVDTWFSDWRRAPRAVKDVVLPSEDPEAKEALHVLAARPSRPTETVVWVYSYNEYGAVVWEEEIRHSHSLDCEHCGASPEASFHSLVGEMLEKSFARNGQVPIPPPMMRSTFGRKATAEFLEQRGHAVWLMA